MNYIAISIVSEVKKNNNPTHSYKKCVHVTTLIITYENSTIKLRKIWFSSLNETFKCIISRSSRYRESQDSLIATLFTEERNFWRRATKVLPSTSKEKKSTLVMFKASKRDAMG